MQLEMPTVTTTHHPGFTLSRQNAPLRSPDTMRGLARWSKIPASAVPTSPAHHTPALEGLAPRAFDCLLSPKDMPGFTAMSLDFAERERISASL